MTWDNHNKHSNTKRSPWKPGRESFFFCIVPFMVCCLYVSVASTRAVTCTSAVDKWFAMYPSVFIVVLVNLFLIFAFIVTIQLTLLLGYKYMRLNEGSIQISSQMLEKVFRKFLFWCLGWFSLKLLEVLSLNVYVLAATCCLSTCLASDQNDKYI